MAAIPPSSIPPSTSSAITISTSPTISTATTAFLSGMPTSPTISLLSLTAPFDNPAKADVVLRSCDGADFYVLKAFFSFSSPIFEGLFGEGSVPDSFTSPSSSHPPLPIVELTEDAITLKLLIQFCYPIPHPTLHTLHDVTAVATAASKYCMDAIDRRIQSAVLSSPAIANISPLRLFAIASRHSWTDVARVASTHFTRGSPILPLWKLPMSDELRVLTVGDLHRLHRYHHDCAQAAKSAVLLKSENGIPDLHWLGLRPPTWGWWSSTNASGTCCAASKVPVWVGGAGSRGRSMRFTHEWVLVYLKEVAERMEERPCDESAVDDGAFDRLIGKASQCSECRYTIGSDFRLFAELLKKEVDRAITEVRLETVC